MSIHENLLGGIPATELPDDATVRAEVTRATTPAQLASVAAAHPAASLPGAALAEAALGRGDAVESYAYARVGYHRGLDALRRSGWRGQGPVPWAHVPNQGFLRALAALSRAAAAIGEVDEQRRCAQFVADCDRVAAQTLAV